MELRESESKKEIRNMCVCGRAGMGKKRECMRAGVKIEKIANASRMVRERKRKGRGRI